jgi:crossover junction endodeoxyribonuclease RusA
VASPSSSTPDNVIHFFVPGVPVPQGSKSVSRSGHLYDVNAKQLKAWRKKIAEVIAESGLGESIDTPMSMSVTFCFERPKSHFNKSGLTKNAPRKHTSKPDLDKLIRALGDGIATDAQLLKDDSYIVSVNAEKRYCVGAEQPGAMVTLILL